MKTTGEWQLFEQSMVTNKAFHIGSKKYQAMGPIHSIGVGFSSKFKMLLPYKDVWRQWMINVFRCRTKDPLRMQVDCCTLMWSEDSIDSDNELSSKKSIRRQEKVCHSTAVV